MVNSMLVFQDIMFDLDIMFHEWIQSVSLKKCLKIMISCQMFCNSRGIYNKALGKDISPGPCKLKFVKDASISH